jgi:hypothetical protein
LQERKTYTFEEKELLGEPKNLYIKIPLLQDLKDVPNFNNYINEECIRKKGRKRKYAPTINVVGQLADLMLGKLIIPKYLDLGSPLVNIHINNILVQNTLIDLRFAINVMKRDTMIRLNLQGFMRNMPIVLQLENRSIVKPDGMLEDIIISIDSWE